MSAIDPVAAGGFASAAGHYAKVRPAYAREAIGVLQEVVPPGIVLDVGAGTGILTGQLERAGRSLHAVEPLSEMLVHLRRSLPGTPAVVASGEAMPLRGELYSGVTIAQAFHWMDPRRTLGEVSRVLRQGGVLALMWNVRDESVPWVGELTDLVEERTGGRPYTDHRDRDWNDVVDHEGGFEHLGDHRWSNPIPTTRDGVVERVRSTSYVALLDEGEREQLIVDARRLLAEDRDLAGQDSFDYPHHTVMHLWRRAR
ncbi:MAG: class I SAM-dependent methyltransferase [Microthrixaceae bacterium]